MSFATSYERYFVSLVNQARKDKGLPALKIEKHLNDSADAHSKWMLNADVFSHTGIGGSSSRQRMEKAGLDLAGRWMTAENIAYVSIQGESDLRDEIRQLHSNLMNSPGHYRNIMSNAEFIGLGLQVGHFKLNGRDYKVLMVTQNFADTDGKVSIDTGSFTRMNLPVVNTSLSSKAVWDKAFDGKIYTLPQPTDYTAKADDFRLGPRHDNAFGGAGNDWMAGNGGNDTLNGGLGNDRIIGGLGADLLLGAVGNDSLQGDGGNDRLFGGLGNDLLFGGIGHDHMVGEAGNDRMLGGADNDRMFGGAGNDWLQGDAGNDSIQGDAGNDTLTGGHGNDVMNGGAGADVFIFARGHGRDVIHGYETGVDRIMIPRALLDAKAETFIADHMRKTAAGVVIDMGAAGHITINGKGLTVEAVADDIFGY